MSQAKDHLAELRTTYAYQRTLMASTRTFYVLVRTGLAIAGGGALVASVLAGHWPSWVTWSLSAAFVIIGFTIILGALLRYDQVARMLAVEGEVPGIPVQLVIVLTVALLAATATVLVLFVLGRPGVNCYRQETATAMLGTGMRTLQTRMLYHSHSETVHRRGLNPWRSGSR